MAVVNPAARGGVGSLLRKAQEKDEFARQVRPTAQPTSPIRELIRTTILTPTPPGSARVTSVKPEPEALTPQVVQPTTRAGGQIVPPTAAAGALPVVSPVAPPPPAPAAPAQGAPAAAAPAAAAPAAAATPSATSGQVYQPYRRTPPASSFGRRIVKRPLQPRGFGYA